MRFADGEEMQLAEEILFDRIRIRLLRSREANGEEEFRRQDIPALFEEGEKARKGGDVTRGDLARHVHWRVMWRDMS